jgi:hypothetical protein
LSRTVIGDFEAATPELAGWTPVSGGTVQVWTTDSEYKRGSRSLEARDGDGGGDTGYAYRDPGAVPTAGGKLYVGLWAKRNSSTTNVPKFCVLAQGATERVRLAWVADSGVNDGTFKLTVVDDDGLPAVAYVGSHAYGTWYWLALEIARASAAGASDGAVTLWVDGVSAGGLSSVKNYTSAGALDAVWLGFCDASLSGGAGMYFDDVSVALDSDLGGAATLTPPPWRSGPPAGGRGMRGFGR